MIKYLWCKTFYKLHPYPLNTLVKTWLLFISLSKQTAAVANSAFLTSVTLPPPHLVDSPCLWAVTCRQWLGSLRPGSNHRSTSSRTKWAGKIVLRKLVMGSLTSFHGCKEEILTSIRGREESEWWMVEFKVFKGGLEHLRQLSRSKVNVVCGYVRWQRPTAPPTNDNKY